MPLDLYLALDDHTITEFLKASARTDDAVLGELSAGLLSRRLFKAVDASDASGAGITAFVSRAQSRLQSEKDANYCFAVDTPADTPYKPYDPDADKPATQIYVQTHSGQPREISTISETVAQLRRKYELVRYYFPVRLREDMDRIAKETLAPR
jgi:HD superfamily phosphohydrolase